MTTDLRAVAREIDAVRRTLLTVAGWLPDEDADQLRERAGWLEPYAMDGDLSDTTCCPMCEEVECDSDCPLYELRDAQGLWVGSSGANQ